MISSHIDPEHRQLRATHTTTLLGAIRQKKQIQKNSNPTLSLAKFKDASVLGAPWMQNTLSEGESLSREGWTVKLDVIAGICTEFSEALFETVVNSS